MELGLNTSQRLSQQALATIQLMQYSNAEMVEYVNEILASNPLIDAQEKDEEGAYYQRLKDRFEWMEREDEQNKAFYHSDRQGDEFGSLNKLYKRRTETLAEVLLEQLSALSLPKSERQICRYIIGSLNSDGYFDTPMETAAADMGVSAAKMAQMLEIVQAMEPDGVGAKNLSDCLQIQLRKKNITDNLVHRIVCDDLYALSRKEYSKLAAKYKVKKEKILAAAGMIRQLNPRPSVGFAAAEATEYVIPDVLVLKGTGDEFEVVLNDTHIPHLMVNRDYVRLLSSDSIETKRYVDKKLNQAVWAIQNIDIRRRNIYQAATAIVGRQRDFFVHGPGHLRPLVMTEIAQEIGVHESTVSRILKNKYLQCQFGTFAFGYFFVSKVGKGGDTNGEEVFASSESVQARIEAIIRDEDKHKPYSDQKITDLLNEQGIDIKRRTVSKYRERLGFDTASLRREEG